MLNLSDSFICFSLLTQPELVLPYVSGWSKDFPLGCG